jgi:PST family polysaccharide transporter
MTAQFVRAAFTLLMAVILSRLLDAEQFGIVAMVAPVTALIMLLQNLGLDQAIIQAPSVNRRELSGVFWFNLGLTLFLAALFACFAPLVGKFYGEARATQFAFASALSIVLAGPALVHMALLNRQMRFGAVAWVMISHSASQFAITILAAYHMKSFWAIWIGSTAAAAIQLVALWWVQGWRPQRRIQIAGAKRFLGFGGHLTGFNLANFLARNFDNVLIGRFGGAASLGNYDRAYKLMLFPLQNINEPVSRVILPILARLRSEPAKYRRAFLLTLRSVVLFTMPAVAVVGALSERLVFALLGDGWELAGQIFQLLAVTALIQPFLSALGWLFVSMQRGRELLIWGLLASTVIVCGFIVGIADGAIGVARWYAISNFLLMIPLIAWSSRNTAVSIPDLFSVLIPNLCTSIAVWLLVAHYADGSQPLWLVLLISSFMAYLTSILANLLFANGRDLASLAIMGGRQLWRGCRALANHSTI